MLTNRAARSSPCTTRTPLVFVIGPRISRAREGRVREHTRLDYEWFGAQVYGSTSNEKVLDTFSSVFGPQFSCRFVYVDGCLYVAGHDLVPYMARHRLDQLSAHGDALTASGAHELIVVDDESELHGLLMQRFVEKYDASAGAFVELRPLVLVRE
ncbi:hypothetical protein [Streptomyces mirabilis]|uniref:hypothetical protein n=1 Tax=Streptomyces mirabilis TaxID=68239 RepID=UPI0036E2AD85